MKSHGLAVQPAIPMIRRRNPIDGALSLEMSLVEDHHYGKRSMGRFCKLAVTALTPTDHHCRLARQHTAGQVRRQEALDNHLIDKEGLTNPLEVMQAFISRSFGAIPRLGLNGTLQRSRHPAWTAMQLILRSLLQDTIALTAPMIRFHSLLWLLIFLRV